MRIGDSVIYKGKRYVVVGFTPASVTPAKVELEDEHGVSIWVLLQDLLRSHAPRDTAAYRS